MKKLPVIIAVLALSGAIAHGENDDVVKPTPTPSVHRHSSTKSKSSSRKKVDPDEDSDTTSTHRFGATKKPAKKTDSDDDTGSSTPSPSPAKKKTATHKKTDDDTQTSTSVTPSPTATPSPSSTSTPRSANSAFNASLTSDQISEFAKQPDNVKKLLESALELTRQDLTYTYGSADPANGGMDCSGFIYYVLRENGFKDVPRDASGQYVWVRKAKLFQAVLSTHKDSFELNELKPGDLLFWTGTYSVQKDPPVTHTMIYLGTEKGTHKSVMVGSTDGRTYNGKSRWGVSVFDFKANTPSVVTDSGTQKPTRAAFVGYAHIPGLRDE